MERQEKKAAMLIVDDQETDRSVLAQIFKDAFAIFEAVNGQAALCLLEKCGADVILLDTMMPVMDGFEFLGAIRRDERFADIPVVMITSREESGSEVRAIELGALDCLVRPLHPAVAVRRVQNVMARAENEWRKIEQAAQLRQIEEMRQKIERDPLTGLYGRESFCRRAAELIRQAGDIRYAVFCFDISFFKVLNDLFGMEMGDLVLRTVGAYLRHVASGLGLAGRFTADRFVLALPEAAVGIETILQGLDDAVAALSIPHHIQFYAGVYQVADPTLSVEQMCGYANMALASVKGSHHRQSAVYDEAMQEKIREEQMIRREMDYALESGQFSIFIQPVRSLTQGRDVAGEALARWFHPARQMIVPDRFLALFERSGFIRRLDRFACEEACKLLRRILDEFGRALPLSVNISQLDFYDEDLVGFFLGLMEKYCLPPDHLWLELTENTYAANPRQVVAVVRRLRDVGFRVFVDGFGSGQTSSLNLLRNMPVDGIKIAASFMEGEESDGRRQTILQNLLTMARDLHMIAAVKGVEREDEVARLRAAGGDLVQGYYFAPPLSGDDYVARLRGEASWP